jgi:predicted DNA-binding transcriptional regulator YafY
LVKRRGGPDIPASQASDQSALDQPSAAAISSQQVAPWPAHRVTARGPSEVMVARQLAGFADAIEVVGPEAVRRHLGEIGLALVHHYGGAGAGASGGDG